MNVTLAAVTAWLKVAVGAVEMALPVALLAGVVPVTAGAVRPVAVMVTSTQ
ncbi:hypothetical protein AB4Y80_06230 [Specibacter sp. RAF43]